ncbi:hypothetical protein Xen7305DRAFT_00037030 [Xenococcus sp. PCC 7305]|nr:hypothetical protein Xen7305DRAFT_00037030 [Xenococcus sp. PCC 7305]
MNLGLRARATEISLVDAGVNKLSINEGQKADVSRLITYYFRAAVLGNFQRKASG